MTKDRKEYLRKYYQEHKLERDKYDRQYREKHQIAIIERQREYNKKHKIEIARRSKEYDKKHKTEKVECNRKRIYFRDTQVKVEINPRIGVCNYCRAVVPFDCKFTSMHHDENRYDRNNPLRYTIEICVSCHSKETIRLNRVI